MSDTPVIDVSEEVESSNTDDEEAEAEAEPESEVEQGEPTGEDPDGTVDVAGDTAERVPADGESVGDDPESTADAAPDGDTDAADAEDDSDAVEDEQPDAGANEAASEDADASEADNEATEEFRAIVDASTFDSFLTQLQSVVEESKLHLKPDGLEATAVDAANVAMVSTTLKPAAFESYTAGGGVIGVNLDQLADIIGMANSGDLVTLELNPDTMKLEIATDNLSYTMSLIDPDSIRQEPDIPDMELDSTVELDPSQLSRGIKAADMVADHLGLRADSSDEVFFIEAEGDTDDASFALSEDDVEALDVGDSESLFSLDYMKDLKKALNEADSVTMRFDDDFPVKFYTNYAEDLATATIMLAPRIQSD